MGSVLGPIAVVPARGGSKRIPRKNIRPFLGVPLIARTIETLKSSDLFERIVVSTDDEEIAEVARHAGAEIPFIRSSELSDDHTPTVPVVLDAIKRLEVLSEASVGEICVVYPAAVFVTSADLVAAHQVLTEKGADSVFCAAAHAAPILRSWRQRADGFAEMIWPEHASTRSQDLETAYFDTGQFYWWASGTWKRRAAGKPVTAAMHVLERWRVQDIDDEEDWRAAELTFQLLERLDQ